MLSPGKMGELLKQARRNEEILKRLDKVETLLLSRNDLSLLLPKLCQTMSQVYELEAATMVLSQDHKGLWRALGGEQEKQLPENCFWRKRKELRLLLLDLERPFLCNRVEKELIRCLFPLYEKVKSLCVLPLWSGRFFWGALCLGSYSSERYDPDMKTDFLDKLSRLISQGIETALLLEESRLLERKEAALEMAGAACHELAQPVTTLAFMAEKMFRTLKKDNPLRPQVQAFIDQVDKVGELVHRISEVSDYATKPYALDLQIVDIDTKDKGQAKPCQKEEKMTDNTYEDCIFCKIVKGELPCFKVYEDERVLAFSDINPASEGHTLVISKNHAENLMEMDIKDLAAVHIASKKIAKAVKKAVNCEGVTIMQLNGKASNQVVMHYHVHIIPRNEGDGLGLGHYANKPGDMDKIKDLAAKISENI